MSCPTTNCISGCDFADYLVSQTPVYDKLILEDITPVDGWIGNMSVGTWEAFTGAEHTLDRFTDVWPDTTKSWDRVQNASCIGNPCDPPRYSIGMGAKRLTYFLEKQSWRTQLFCFDQMLTITHAKEHMSQIISNVLKPATSAIMSSFMRKRALINAGKKWVASATMPDFTFTFSLGSGDTATSEIFFDTSIAPTAVFLLTPQMLQRRFAPLMAIGYGGKNPFKDTAPFIELVTSIETTWTLDRLGGQTGVGGSAPSVGGNWRFDMWEAANKFWRYGFNGQLGNYMVRVDNDNLRFNFVRDLGAGSAPNRYRYQVVQPYTNITTSGAGGAPGLGRIRNDAYDNAHFEISFIWHKKGMEALVLDTKPVNPEMPFSSRNFAGKWQFVMDNLGADCDGRAIANFLRNKGMFVADFELAIRPLYTEFVEAIFNKREPMCVYNVDTCSADPGYPTQSYNSANPACTATNTISFTPELRATTGTYEIAANSILCDQTPISHAAITGTSTLTALVAQLNSLVSPMGTFAVNGTAVDVTSSACQSAQFPFIVD